MDTFWIVTLFHFQPEAEALAQIEHEAIAGFGALGIEEFSLTEPEVDGILGERSYSGGDLPLEIIQEVEDTVLRRPTNYRFFFQEEKAAKAFGTFCATNVLCETQVEEARSEDWNAEWKKHYSPILINRELEIVPSWMKDHPSPAKHKLFINPGMGFGTGSHETTFLCLKLFTEHCLTQKVENVLDFGSGSGILGLSTFLFYPAARVDFYDIDEAANENCFQNAELNGLGGQAFRLLLPSVRDRLQRTYDIVFANILESILIEEKVALVSFTKPGGHLILSGILRHQMDGIIQAYEDELELVSRVQKGDWGALLFRKAE